MRALVEALCLSAGLALALHTAAPSAFAEDVAKPAASKKKVGKKRARAAKPKPDKKQEKPPEIAPERTAIASKAASAAQATTSNAQIVKDGDTSVKVMNFEGLGIEGRLKSPQLVYFVQRVQAEFERPVLPHRSFMPELADTTAREPLR